MCIYILIIDLHRNKKQDSKFTYSTFENKECELISSNTPDENRSLCRMKLCCAKALHKLVLPNIYFKINN